MTPVFTVRFCAQLLIVVVTLALGGFGLWIGVESLVRGEVEYLTKESKVLTLSRAEHPGPYWSWTGGSIAGAGLITWFSLWAFRASLNESRRLRSGGQA